MLEIAQLNKITNDEIKDLVGYFGTWVQVMYFPFAGSVERAYFGRLVGWLVDSPHALVFEGYALNVDGSHRVCVLGVNEPGWGEDV